MQYLDEKYFGTQHITLSLDAHDSKKHLIMISLYVIIENN